MTRCINIDWLEVFCREPLTTPHDASYFVSCGFVVHEREYGTRVYRQMFTLDGTDGLPLLEVRRDPASQGLNGIHDVNECHIRLVNRTCYFDNAASLLSQFLQTHGYYDVRISRIDLCLDFVEFDMHDNPQAFVRRYFAHRYAKINQGNISSHGADTWNGQEWNSLSWGAKSSPVSTKLYNKTLELFNQKDNSYGKPYIRYAWLKAGLIDDMNRVTLQGEKQQVWRLEFSLRSSVKGWLPIEIDGKNRNYQSIKNTLECYDTKEKMLVIFASLQRHYFRFKKYQEGVRKDRCEDKVLFVWNDIESFVKVGRDSYTAGNGTLRQARYAKLIAQLEQFQETHAGIDLHKACDLLIEKMREDNMREDLADPWSWEELQELKALVHLRTTNKDLSYEAAMHQVKQWLAVTDRTLPLF